VRRINKAVRWVIYEEPTGASLHTHEVTSGQGEWGASPHSSIIQEVWAEAAHTPWPMRTLTREENPQVPWQALIKPSGL